MSFSMQLSPEILEELSINKDKLNTALDRFYSK